MVISVGQMVPCLRPYTVVISAGKNWATVETLYCGNFCGTNGAMVEALCFSKLLSVRSIQAAFEVSRKAV